MKIPARWRLPNWRWPLAFLVFVFISMSLFGRYFPWLVAQFWYLRHWNGVPFLGKVIPVPRGMVSASGTVSKPDSVSFVEFPPAMNESSARIAWGMSFTRDNLPHSTTEDAVKLLGTNLRIVAARAGTEVGPAFPVGSQGGDGWCYRTTVPPRNNLITNCLLFNAEWWAVYTGPPSHEEEFFKVIAGIHDLKK